MFKILLNFSFLGAFAKLQKAT